VEHLFFLVDELLHVQLARLFRELDALSSNLHCFLNEARLVRREGERRWPLVLLPISVFVVIGRWDVRVFHAAKRGARRRRVLIPDLLVAQTFLSFFLLGLLGFSRHEDLLVIGRLEG
jgi:hypothetical protein